MEIKGSFDGLCSGIGGLSMLMASNSSTDRTTEGDDGMAIVTRECKILYINTALAACLCCCSGSPSHLLDHRCVFY